MTMALHKIRIKREDGTTDTFYENSDGTWDYCIHCNNWFSRLSTQIMIATVCAASDLGAEIKIEKERKASANGMDTGTTQTV